MRVIKIGGRVQAHPGLPTAIAAAWSAERGDLCVVHGGGEAITELQRTLGIEPEFLGGRRVTCGRDVDVVRMALSGVANKHLVGRLVSAGVPALGLSGEDASLLEAWPIDPAALGRVGEPRRINVRLLWHLLDGGYLPVISPLARDAEASDGGALNVNGDDAAAAIAVALEADELLLVADVPGVLVDGMPAHTIDVDEAISAVSGRVASGGMAAKLEAGIAALRRGVECVRIGALDAICDPRCGTTIVASRSVA